MRRAAELSAMEPPPPPVVALEVLRKELHARIDHLEAIIKQPRDPMNEIRTLVAGCSGAKGMTVQELRARGYTALQVLLARVEGLSSLPALVEGGYKWPDLVDAGRSERMAATACLKEGIPVASLVDIGAPLSVLASAAVAGGSSSLLQDLLSAGASVQALAEAGASVSALMKCGMSAQRLLQEGVAVERLVESGVPAKNLVEQCGVKLGSFTLPMGTPIALTTFSYVQRKDLTIQGGGPREYSICWMVEAPGGQRHVRTETMSLEYMLRNGLKLV